MCLRCFRLPTRWQQQRASLSQPVPDNGRLELQQQQHRRPQQQVEERRCFVVLLAAVIRQFTRHLPLATRRGSAPLALCVCAQCGELSTNFIHLI